MKYKLILHSLLFVLLITSFVISGCAEEKLIEKADPEYLKEIEEWHNRRISNLKKEESWLNLIGLFWLNEGVNKFGSAKDNDIVFPKDKAPQYIGSIYKQDSVITLTVNDGVEMLHEGAAVKKLELKHDLTGDPAKLSIGSLRWYIIKRGERYGVRLRDVESNLLLEFKGIDRYPVNSDWRKEASYVAFDPPKEIEIPSYQGGTETAVSVGSLVFTHNDIEYRLDALDSGNRLFIIFADETSGEETYGGGRYIYTDKPDSNGVVVLDFNKAYNPPCVFTKYATCPLPPKQNYLRLRITAGEKNFTALQ